MERVRIEAGNGYDVLIGPGLLDQAGQQLARVMAPCRVMIVTDDTVRGLYTQRVQRSLAAAGFESRVFSFPAGERHKTLATLSAILEAMGAWALSRSDAVAALGGGVPGDAAGFAAAVYGRGMPFFQIPTTLLAAVDASVGGKTAVDLKAGKNLAGAFHQPELVLCDSGVMKGLPAHLVRDGSAEMIKHGILADPGLFDALRTGQWKEDLAGTIARNVRIKRDFVRGDEEDRGKRQFLNLGHTFGHAIETCSGFTLTHGQGVAMGLVMAALAAGMDPKPIREACRACGLPTECPYSAAELAEAALGDKKRRGGEITLVLPEAVGKCHLKTIPLAEMPLYFRKGTGEAK